MSVARFVAVGAGRMGRSMATAWRRAHDRDRSENHGRSGLQPAPGPRLGPTRHGEAEWPRWEGGA